MCYTCLMSIFAAALVRLQSAKEVRSTGAGMDSSLWDCMLRPDQRVHIVRQASKGEDSDPEGLRVKLRAAVKKGKAIDKQRADLETQVARLQEQV